MKPPVAARLGFDRALLETAVSLYGIQALSLLLPLILWPWLARVLGPAQAGLLALTEAAARYVALGVEYGFQLSATRDIARCAADRQRRARVVSAVISGQLLLAAAAALLTTLLWLLLPALKPHPGLVLSALVWGVALGATPLWHFQGMERMRFAAAADAGFRLAAVAAILLTVRDARSAWLAPAIHASAAAAACALCWRRVLRESGASAIGLSGGAAELRRSFPVFLFRAAVSLYTTGNVLLLGLLGRAEMAGLFAAAEKLVKAAVSGIYPISQAMYPRVARLLVAGGSLARLAVLRSLRLTMAIGLLAGLTLAAAAAPLVRFLFGPGFEPAAPLVATLSLLAPLIAASNVLGLQWMLPNRMERSMNAALAAAAAVNVLLAWVLVPRFGAQGMAWAVVAAEASVTVGVVASLARAGRLPWIDLSKREELAHAES